MQAYEQAIEQAIRFLLEEHMCAAATTYSAAKAAELIAAIDKAETHRAAVLDQIGKVAS